MTKLQLGDGQIVRVSMIDRRYITIPKGKQSHIDIGSPDVFQTFVSGTLIGGNIVLHGDDLIPRFSQGIKDDLPIFFQVFERGGEIDRWHDREGFLESKKHVRSLFKIYLARIRT